MLDGCNMIVLTSEGIDLVEDKLSVMDIVSTQS